MRIIHCLGLAVLSFFVLASCGGGGGGGGNGFVPSRYWLNYLRQNVVTKSWEIHQSRSDGTGDQVLINAALTGAERPSPSPDGTKLAYYKPTGVGTAGIFVLDITSGVATPIVQLARSDGSYGPIDWRRDGTRLLYVPSTGKLSTVNVDGSDVLQLTPGTPGTWDLNGSWSPDGAKVVTQRTEYAGDGLWTMSSGGINQVSIAENGSLSYQNPGWLSNSQIVCRRDGTPQSDEGLAIMGADGSGVLKIPNFQNRWADHPRCSPDGTMIAFDTIMVEGGPLVIGIVEVATGRVFFGIGSGVNPNWFNGP